MFASSGEPRIDRQVLQAKADELDATIRKLTAMRDGLRHAAASLRLNAGVSATEVARRAGHGVAVLLKVYANCIDGQAIAANQRISDALDGS